MMKHYYILKEVRVEGDKVPRKVVTTQSSGRTRKSRPPLTPEGQEEELIGLAVDAARQQLINGTASAQVIVHYLKLGSTVARLERDKLKNENLLLEAKRDAIKSGEDVKATYEEALNAMRRYSGNGNDDEY